MPRLGTSLTNTYLAITITNSVLSRSYCCFDFPFEPSRVRRCEAPFCYVVGITFVECGSVTLVESMQVEVVMDDV